MEAETTGFPISISSTTCSTAQYSSPSSARGSRRDTVQLREPKRQRHATRAAPQVHSGLEDRKAPPEGKEAERKGLGNLGGGGWGACEARSRAGKVTSVSKVEQVLLPVPPASPPGRSSRAPAPRERSGRLKAPRRSGSTRPLGCRGGGGLPGSVQVSAAAHPHAARAFALRTHRPWCENFRSASPQPAAGLARIPSLPHPDPAACAPRPGPSIRLLRTPADGISFPSPIASPRPGKVWPQPAGLESRTHPAGSGAEAAGARGSRGRRRRAAAARARSSSQRPLLPLPPTELEKGRRRRGVTCRLSHPAA